MTPLQLLRSRASVSSRLLQAPGPNADELAQLLNIAMRVPDHGKLTPWRFLLIQEEARQRTSDRLCARKLALEPGIGVEALEKERLRFLHAPVIVVVIAQISKPHKIPEIEQRLSAGAVCMQLLNAAAASGFAGQWLTGWAAYDADIAEFLGLAENESVAGFIHLGHSTHAAPERPRPSLADKLSSL
jgi:nitroreductase